jgi:hypothetical protein
MELLYQVDEDAQESIANQMLNLPYFTRVEFVMLILNAPKSNHRQIFARMLSLGDDCVKILMDYCNPHYITLVTTGNLGVSHRAVQIDSTSSSNTTHAYISDIEVAPVKSKKRKVQGN